jgi:endonuclease/exonuclease/phosphatase family metal-dependent hydrolase
MKIATYNVHKCVGAGRTFSPSRIAAVIGEIGADIVALQEVDRRFGRRTGLLDMQALQHHGMHLLTQSDLPDGHGFHGNALLVRKTADIRRASRFSLPGLEPRGGVLT